MSDTPDDPMQDPTVLASAYLDGEVTPDERARVEADAALLAEVDRLRRVRGLLLAEIEPARVSTREAHLAAALDVWDQLGAPTPSGVTPIAPTRARRERRRSGSGDRMRVALGVAAGLVVVAGVGAVIRGVIVGSNSDSDDGDIASSAEDAAEEPAEEIGPAEQDIATEFEGGNTNDELRTDIDESEVAIDPSDADVAAAAEAPTADAEMAEDVPAEEPAEEPAEAMADDGDDAAEEEGDASPSAEDPPRETDLVVLETPLDLADFAAPAAYAPAPIDDDVLEAAFADCREERPDGLGIDRLAEPAIVVVDGVGEVVSIGVDLDDGIAYAFRDDCTVVLDALLPSEEEFLADNPPIAPTTDAP